MGLSLFHDTEKLGEGTFEGDSWGGAKWEPSGRIPLEGKGVLASG